MNPLLDIRFRVPFDQVRAEHVEPAVQQLLEDAQARLDALATGPAPRTYANTMQALEDATEPLDYALNVVRHLESVATYPELRAAHNATQPLASAFYSSIPLNKALWQQLQAFAATGEARALTGTRGRLLGKTLDTFRRHGADLDEAGKKRLEQIDVELSRVTTRFSQNVLDATNAWEMLITDELRLKGLPDSAIAAARESAAAKGLEGWRFTLQAPSYTALMTYLDDAVLREEMYRAYGARCLGGEYDNREWIGKILELRREKATLLGFATFAGLVLEDRMAHTGARAQQFLLDMRTRTVAHFERENSDLQAFRRGLEGPGAPDPQSWDLAYYAEKQRQSLYDFDEEELRPYFELERVTAGMFKIVERLYGIRVTASPGLPVWDPQVRYYAVHDEDGDFLGGFYTDWYPRENKRGGGWMDTLLMGYQGDDGFKPHLGLICGNLTPPLADRPALLTHHEVGTIFHEFGHLLHQLLSRVEVRSLAGTNVAWDFVELPSQIMENWCWEREALDLFARHYQTGAAIPEALFAKMKRARCFRAANQQMRQLGLGVIDLALHIDYSPARNGDPILYSRRILQEYSAAPVPETHAMIAGFSHLFASPVGYGAGYYSYKWAEVLDADAFTRFRDGGIFSREVGMEFRNSILAKGDSQDPAELYRAFMKRDPDPEALLRRSGLIA